jgi:hypothetical protein
MSVALRPQRDLKVFTGQANASGGTATFDFPVPTDRLCYLRAVVGGHRADAGHHLLSGAGVCAEYWIENKNGTLAATTAITGSNNPANSANRLTANAEASDADYNNAGGGTFFTAAWSISTTNARLTVTNNSTNASVADISVWLDIWIFGST